MSHTFEELKHKTIIELREIAAGLGEEAVKGYSQLNKEHLLAALCQALKIEMHAQHQVVGVDKAAIKAKMKLYRQKRGEATQAKDHAQLKRVRRTLHRLKRKIHKSSKLTK